MTDPDARIAKAGSLLRIESGEYSDYQVHGFFVVLRDFDPLKELSTFPPLDEDDSRYEKNADYYLPLLLAKGLLLEIEAGVLDLGHYVSDERKFIPVIAIEP